MDNGDYVIRVIVTFICLFIFITSINIYFQQQDKNDKYFCSRIERNTK